MPSRIILHGVEKIGKSSFAAQAPGVVFGMSKGETGLLTLIDAGIAPETPHFPEFQAWDDVLGAVDMLTNEPHDYRTFVLDTGNGCERLCHEYVCARDYGNNWGKTGFANYSVGYDVSVNDWRKLLVGLDRLREVRRMMVMILCHTKIKTFKNPQGSDYDRYMPDMHEKTWSVTHKWADIILFANFETFTDKDKDSNNRVKGVGGQSRVIHTVRHAAFDAGNRHNLVEEIDMGGNGKEAWANFSTAIRNARKKDGE